MAVLKRLDIPDTAGFKGLLDKLISRWSKGKSVVRITNEIRVLSCLQIFDGCVFEDMPSPSELVLSNTNPIALQHQAAYANRASADNGILNAVFSYTVNSALLQSDTPNYFQLSDGLLSALMSTELREVYPDDISLPFPGFYLEIPKGYFWWHHPATGYHPVELIGIAEVHKSRAVSCELAGLSEDTEWALGYRLLVVVYGGPNENSKLPADDGCGFFSIPMHTSDQAIESMWEEQEILGEREGGWARAQKGKIGDREVDGRALRAAVRHLCLNFLLYIGSCPEDVRHIHTDAIAKIHKARKTKGRNYGKKRLGVLESERTYLVGTDVYLNKDAADYGRNGGASHGTPRQVQFRSVVRGHWRRQPHGPKSSKRKLIWVKPHSRGGDAEKVFGHNYTIR